MTTIEDIKNECREIIAQADKATPGPWRRAATFYIGDANDNRVAELMGAKYAIQNVENGYFIASSRSFTPRAAKALLDLIADAEDRAIISRRARRQLTELCATWEESK